MVWPLWPFQKPSSGEIVMLKCMRLFLSGKLSGSHWLQISVLQVNSGSTFLNFATIRCRVPDSMWHCGGSSISSSSCTQGSAATFLCGNPTKLVAWLAGLLHSNFAWLLFLCCRRLANAKNVRLICSCLLNTHCQLCCETIFIQYSVMLYNVIHSTYSKPLYLGIAVLALLLARQDYRCQP